MVVLKHLNYASAKVQKTIRDISPRLTRVFLRAEDELNAAESLLLQHIATMYKNSFANGY